VQSRDNLARRVKIQIKIRNDFYILEFARVHLRKFQFFEIYLRSIRIDWNFEKSGPNSVYEGLDEIIYNRKMSFKKRSVF